MLNLVKDEIAISKHFTSYLTKTKVSDWKYEDVIKQPFDLSKLKNENSVTYSEAEHRKKASVIEHMEFLCAASPIKKIIREKKWQYTYQQTLENGVLDAVTVKEDSWETKKKTVEKNFKNLSVADEFVHLATYYGEDGILNFQHAKLPKRFNKYLKKMKDEAGIDLMVKTGTGCMYIQTCGIRLSLGILSQKRTVKLNHAKFNLILKKKYKNEVKTLNFADDIFTEVSFTSNSTNSDEEYEDEYHEENEPEDEDFVENTKVMLDGLKEDEKGLKRFHDWEDMLFDCSKRRKTRN
ncbi:hypothetical protein BDC45DRAFT_588020 [Circinella umbellata]|nr:hypothetical protein BDC45DRAFT_588020 [Circinella umbellata]